MEMHIHHLRFLFQNRSVYQIMDKDRWNSPQDTSDLNQNVFIQMSSLWVSARVQDQPRWSCGSSQAGQSHHVVTAAAKKIRQDHHTTFHVLILWQWKWTMVWHIIRAMTSCLPHTSGHFWTLYSLYLGINVSTPYHKTLHLCGIFPFVLHLQSQTYSYINEEFLTFKDNYGI